MELATTAINQMSSSKTSSYPCQIFEFGDLIINHLHNLDIKYIFGVPGGAIEPFYNAIARSERNNGPKAIVARHESGAVFMADGYAREKGNLAVCCVTTGPGATNALTGIASAYCDGIPLLIISAQTPLHTFGRGASQESSCTSIDTVSLYKHCTRYSTLISHPAQLEYKLVTAISHAFGDTPGPVHISIPLDIMRTSIFNKNQNVRSYKTLAYRSCIPDNNSIDELVYLINSTNKGAFVIGKDAAEAIPYILALAEDKLWPICSTPMGKGLISSYHELNAGVFGLAGHESAYEQLANDNTELIIAVGTELDELSTCGWDGNSLLNNRLVFVDNNAEHLYRAPMAKLRIKGSPKSTLELACERADISVNNFNNIGKNKGQPISIAIQNFQKCRSQNQLIKPQRLFFELSQKCPANTRVTVDIGNSFLWGIHYWQNRNPLGETKNLFHVGLGYATMGWAIGASIGIAQASPDVPVVCMTGDGSILMNGQEITTAIQQNLNVLFVILNDSTLGTVKHGQLLAHAELIAHDLPPVNFAKYSTAMGVKGKRINNFKEWMDLNINEIWNDEGPFVLDVVIDGDEVPPLDMRMKVLQGKQ